jgi:hypothetical protein
VPAFVRDDIGTCGESAQHLGRCGIVPKSKAVLPALRAAAGTILRAGGDFFASRSSG